MTNPDADGWIKHDGGPKPVESSTLLDVRLRDGRVFVKRMARFAPGHWDWPHKYERHNDIIEFRIIEYPRSYSQSELNAAREEGFKAGLEAAKREGEA